MNKTEKRKVRTLRRRLKAAQRGGDESLRIAQHVLDDLDDYHYDDEPRETRVAAPVVVEEIDDRPPWWRRLFALFWRPAPRIAIGLGSDVTWDTCANCGRLDCAEFGGCATSGRTPR